jgi:hypothetical protein
MTITEPTPTATDWDEEQAQGWYDGVSDAVGFPFGSLTEMPELELVIRVRNARLVNGKWITEPLTTADGEVWELVQHLFDSFDQWIRDANRQQQ